MSILGCSFHLNVDNTKWVFTKDCWGRKKKHSAVQCCLLARDFELEVRAIVTEKVRGALQSTECSNIQHLSLKMILSLKNR